MHDCSKRFAMALSFQRKRCLAEMGLDQPDKSCGLRLACGFLFNSSVISACGVPVRERCIENAQKNRSRVSRLIVESLVSYSCRVGEVGLLG